MVKRPEGLWLSDWRVPSILFILFLSYLRGLPLGYLNLNLDTLPLASHLIHSNLSLLGINLARGDTSSSPTAKPYYQTF